MPAKLRTLYQCPFAVVFGTKITCSKGRRFNSRPGYIHISRLAQGKPLAIKVCQDCQEYIERWPALHKAGRGWL